MKMLLVAAGSEHANVLGYHLKPLGFALTQETDPVRAIERIDELDPQAILFNAADFPRHWKPLAEARAGQEAPGGGHLPPRRAARISRWRTPPRRRTSG